MVESLTYTYTSKTEIEALISKEGLELHIDDQQTGPQGLQTGDVIDDAIEYATDEMNSRLLHLYEAVNLSNSLWVRGRATIIAASWVFQRCGNPGYYNERVERIEKELDVIANTYPHRFVPRVVPRGDEIPAMSNLRVDDRRRGRKIRVDPDTSIGTYPNQDLDSGLYLP